MPNDEIVGYDLSTAGTVVEIERTSSDVFYELILEATASADFALEIEGGSTGPFTVETFSAATFIDRDFNSAAGVTIRVKNTTTTASGETADAILGTGDT